MIKHTASIRRESSSLSVSISPADNVPYNQVYEEESKGYIPDHTLVPLILVPTVMMESEDVGAEYEERGWWRIKEDGSEEQVTNALSGHTLWPTGYPLGLRISANIPYGTISKYVFRIKARGARGAGTVSLRTNIATAAAPSVELDCPAAQAWNPLQTDRDRIVITPTVKARGKVCTIRWRKVVNGIRRNINPDDFEDIELSLDSATNALTIDRRLMGNRVSLVCELLVGNTIIDEKPVTMTRRIPERTDGIDANTFYSKRDSIIHAKARIELHPGGILQNPLSELDIKWYDGSSVVGEGETHDYPLEGETERTIGMEATDRGPWLLLTDGDGTYLTDGDGRAIIVR